MKSIPDTIAQIRAEKQQRKVWPTHATHRDLLNAGHTHEAIRDAVRAGQIKFGRTLNSYYFFVESE